ncbi:MAG: SOS response-associated peptidase [Gammaproteobacteria bacterium]|nr:SOS response-associated peptidase [Gammaproteobacteria bacterium]
MCGRFNLITDANALLTAFDLILDLSPQIEFDFPRFNIAPSSAKHLSKIPIVRATPGGRKLSTAVWPLIPHWAKGQLPKFSTANARAERMREAPSYRNAWRKGQRCLIPASGFYEWQEVPGKKTKQPYHIYLPHSPLFAMAGLWEMSFNEKDEKIESCTIVTTEANELLAKIHKPQRMPVILDREDYERWLSGSAEDADTCIKAYDTNEMKADKISTRVNNPSSEDERIIDALED